MVGEMASSVILEASLRLEALAVTALIDSKVQCKLGPQKTTGPVRYLRKNIRKHAKTSTSQRSTDPVDLGWQPQP